MRIALAVATEKLADISWASLDFAETKAAVIRIALSSAAVTDN
jgi:hypothetical protein